MQIAALKGTKQGRLRLGVVSTAKYFVPRLLGCFCQQYPGIDIALQVTNHATLIQRMQDNQDDLYILSQPPEDIALSTQPFLDNPLVVVARQDHPLVGEKNIPIKSLMGEPFIMREQGSGTRHAVQKLFERYKVGVKVRLELGSNEAIKQAIAGGLGLSVLSQHTLVAEQLMGELTILDVQHFPIHLRWYVTHLEGKQLSIIAETFLKFLLENTSHIPTLGTLGLHKEHLNNNNQGNLVKMG
jgi:DNA-binding transcriptional LysR family regulator